jgi:hypothetical protein
LSADGASIRPTAAGNGTYSFVVPSGKGRVRLESRSAILVEVQASFPGNRRRVGVRVGEIAIRSGTGQELIAADDPRLIVGWYEAECEGRALWQWTDGSAERSLGPAFPGRWLQSSAALGLLNTLCVTDDRWALGGINIPGPPRPLRDPGVLRAGLAWLEGFASRQSKTERVSGWCSAP